jgi:hypothetical protein
VNAALQFHDSDVKIINSSADVLRVTFSGAYVHRSTGRPGIDAGSGYIQPAELAFSRAEWSVLPPGCIDAISDGELVVNGKSMSLVPLPFYASGEISVRLTFVSGASFFAKAESVSCKSLGDGRFVETYAAG